MRKLRWVQSAGGPLLLLPVSLRRRWSGIEPTKDPLNDAKFRWDETMAVPSDYDRACDVSGLLTKLDIGDGYGLVLGEQPLSTAWLSAEGQPGGLLVRWYYGDSQAEVERSLQDVPARLFRHSKLVFTFTGRMAVLFDSAIPGRELPGWQKESFCRFRLAAGRYAVSTAEYSPSDETKLILHRLAPLNRPSGSVR